MDVFYFYDTYRARDEVKEIIEIIRTRAFAGRQLLVGGWMGVAGFGLKVPVV